VIAVELAVDQALGPGVEVEVDAGIARAVEPRAGGLWLGLDRAHLVDSDAGDGTELPAVVALPGSTFTGCRLTAELSGALVENERVVLVGRLPGTALPPLAVLRTVAAMPGATMIAAPAAERVSRDARQRFKVRRQSGRVLGGRAWRAAAPDPGRRRFTTPHSRAEYRLDRLPPRFLRGLAGLLDEDERIIYSIERPPDSIRTNRLGLPRRGAERRAGLLLLTDRQLIWMVDHLPPDRYLLDWGVDVRLMPVETLQDVHLTGREVLELGVRTAGGPAAFPLPLELRAEAEVLRDLAGRFVPPASGASLVRRYAPPAVRFDTGPAALFAQEADAERELDALRARLAPEELLAAFYAPRREGAPHPAAMAALTVTRMALQRPSRFQAIPLDHLRSLSITLSPLAGRVELAHGAADAEHLAFSYPATTSAAATALVRMLRKAWADRASIGAARDVSAQEGLPAA